MQIRDGAGRTCVTEPWRAKPSLNLGSWRATRLSEAIRTALCRMRLWDYWHDRHDWHQSLLTLVLVLLMPYAALSSSFSASVLQHFQHAGVREAHGRQATGRARQSWPVKDGLESRSFQSSDSSIGLLIAPLGSPYPTISRGG